MDNIHIVLPLGKATLGQAISMHHTRSPLQLGVFMPLVHQIMSEVTAELLSIQDPFINTGFNPLRLWLEAPSIYPSAMHFARQIL